MPWPWVSRERLEDAQRQLRESETERRRLLDRLLGDDKPATPKAPVSVEEDTVDSGNIMAFTTPFDSIGRKFDRASEADKAKFKVRI